LHIPIGNKIVNNLSHLKDVSDTLNMLNLKYAQPLKGFDPKFVFFEHLASMRYIYQNLWKN
jgi:hypothetical protein